MVWTSFGLLPRAKFHIYRGNVSPVWGEKPIFGLLSKNSTGMAKIPILGAAPLHSHIFLTDSDEIWHEGAKLGLPPPSQILF